jgi:hypothetical protein
MAGKAHRAAARQAQLNRRRKKTQRGPSGIPTALADAEAQSDAGAATVAANGDGAVTPRSGPVREAVAAPRTAAAPRAVRPNASPLGAGRIRGERPAAYNYVGAELRRIGVLSVSVIAVLVVLGILL